MPSLQSAFLMLFIHCCLAMALYELKKEAYEVGANAVVGIDLDYVELSGAGSMVMLVASGTAVKVEC